MDRKRFLRIASVLGFGYAVSPWQKVAGSPSTKQLLTHPVLRWIIIAIVEEVARRFIVEPLVDRLLGGGNTDDGSRVRTPARRIDNVRANIKRRGFDFDWTDSSETDFHSFAYSPPAPLSDVERSPDEKIIGASIIALGSNVDFPTRESQTMFLLSDVDYLEPIAIMPESHHIAIIALARQLNASGHNYGDLANWLLPAGLLLESGKPDDLWSLNSYQTANGRMNIKTTSVIDEQTGEIKSLSGYIDIVRKLGDSDYWPVSVDVEKLKSHYV